MSTRPQTPVKAILFDKDGTLIDFQQTWSPAFARLLDTMAAGNALVKTELARITAFNLETGLFEPHSPFVAGANDAVIGEWAQVMGIADTTALLREIEAHLKAFGLESLAPFPALEATIRTLHEAGYILGIATNDTESSARAQMRALGIEQCFAQIYGYDSGFGAKPAPGMVMAFQEQNGLHPQEVAMVGDSLHDMHAGRQAGAVAVAVATGTIGADILAPHADHVLTGLDDLLDWLDAMMPVH
ncbi:HAD family hydrolase [Pannonibacter phragmitetus]|uniref:HAD family hydrolase n=1 Tax=Pannonibacter phragmitetus TaxID=121719 RepID=UPI000F041F1B|nr:HAD family hydrolase [Pannonibacter phragmitetus]